MGLSKYVHMEVDDYLSILVFAQFGQPEFM